MAVARSIFFEEFFTQENSFSFIEESWSEISIEQKTAFEDALDKELGLEKQNKSVFSFLKPKSRNHPLSGYARSALCHDQRNDDALFVTRKIDSNHQFAIVHLTWKGKKELEGYPNTSFYVDFEDFKGRKLVAAPMDYGEAFLKKAKKYNLMDRVMFGSDQMVWPGAIEKSIKTLDGYDFLTEEDKRKIFYENAVRFLRLTEEDLKGN